MFPYPITATVAPWIVTSVCSIAAASAPSTTAAALRSISSRSGSYPWSVIGSPREARSSASVTRPQKTWAPSRSGVNSDGSIRIGSGASGAYSAPPTPRGTGSSA